MSHELGIKVTVGKHDNEYIILFMVLIDQLCSTC